MKVVKLNKSHTLFHLGYPIALRFSSPWSKGTVECRRALNGMFKDSNSAKWITYRAGTNRPYWIGVKEEKYMTLLLLKVEFPK